MTFFDHLHADLELSHSLRVYHSALTFPYCGAGRGRGLARIPQCTSPPCRLSASSHIRASQPHSRRWESQTPPATGARSWSGFSWHGPSTTLGTMQHGALRPVLALCTLSALAFGCQSDDEPANVDSARAGWR